MLSMEAGTLSRGTSEQRLPRQSHALADNLFNSTKDSTKAKERREAGKQGEH